MIYYIAFIIFMPIFTYIDFKTYKSRILGLLSEQPDYDENRENYVLLHEKMCEKQKKTSTMVCSIICALAFVLLILSVA